MNSPAFQFYPKDWLSSSTTSLMSLAQEGAYIRLLSYAWLDENCGIPDDPEKLSRLLRITRQDFDGGGYQMVIAQFKPHPSVQGVLVNERLILEREKQALWRSKSIDGGKKGAAKRWGSVGQRNNGGGHKMVKAPLMPNRNQSMALQFAVCSLHSTTPQPSAADIYDAYPRKVGKPKALKAIEKAAQKLCPACLHELVKNFAALRAGEDPQFTPHPSTWFNQERYNDDPTTWKSNAVHRTTNITIIDRNTGTHNENYDHAAAQRKVR